MSPELETLDQLQGGDLPLATLASLFPSIDAFRSGILGLLSCGDIVLTAPNGADVLQWRWKELLSGKSALEGLSHIQVKITPQGARRIG